MTQGRQERKYPECLLPSLQHSTSKLIRIRGCHKKIKSFRVAGFGRQKIHKHKCVFSEIHAEQKHSKLQFCKKKVRKLYFYDNHVL